jgi:hypothetical protein
MAKVLFRYSYMKQKRPRIGEAEIKKPLYATYTLTYKAHIRSIYK